MKVRGEKVQDEKRRVRCTGKRKWQVVTRYYDDERVESSAPVLMNEVTDECGWKSHDYNDYVEYTDIFDTEKSALRFIRDNEDTYGFFFSMLSGEALSGVVA